MLDRLSARASCFNPRARDGREISHKAIKILVRRFNPRARDGREDPMGNAYFAGMVSIHAPVMDANEYRLLYVVLDLFQSTRP